MAIRNPLTTDLNNINERIRNRQDVGNLVNDQLFWLLKNEQQKRFIVDNNLITQLQDLNTNLQTLNGRIAIIEPERNTLRDTTIPNLETNIRSWTRDTAAQTQTVIDTDPEIAAINTWANGRDIIREELRNWNVDTRIDTTITNDATMEANRTVWNTEIEGIDTRLSTRNMITRRQEILDDTTLTFHNSIEQITTRKTDITNQLNDINTELRNWWLSQPEINWREKISKNLNEELKRLDKKQSDVEQDAKQVAENEHRNILLRKEELKKQIKELENKAKTQVDAEFQQRQRRLNELNADVERIERNVRERIKNERDVAKEQANHDLEVARRRLEELQTEMRTLETLRNNNQNFVNLRQTELTEIRNQINRFNLTTQRLPDQNVNLRQNIANPINLDGQFFVAGQIPNFREYEICDINTGEILTPNDGALSVSLVWGQNVSVRGMTIVRNPQTQEPELRINNLQITPIENIQFPTVLQLTIRSRIQEQNTTTFLDHYKTIDIRVDSWQLAGSRMVGWAIEDIDPTTGQPYPRVQAYNNLNQNGSINQRITAEYADTNRIAIENEAIWSILSAGGNETEINTIRNNEEIRNALIARIRTIPGLIPVIDLPTIQQQFRYEMTRQDNTTIPAEALVNIITFTDYLRKNFPEKVREFARTQIERTINTWPNRNLVLGEFMNFQTNQETNKVQNRVIAYNNLNQNGNINTRIAAEYSEPNRTTIENEVIRGILEANGNKEEMDKIRNNSQQRDILIQRIRTIPNLIPIINLATLQQGFMNEMTRANNITIPAEAYITVNTFTDYLRANLTEKVGTFVKWQIERAINTTAQRNNILRTVMDFQSDIVNNKLDNNDHTTLDQNVPNLRPQGHPNNRLQRLTRRRSNKNNRTKFFDWRESASFEDKIETNEGEIGFDLKVAVHGVNKIVTTINIKGEDEPIILDTRDVNEMTHMILRLEATKTGEPINRKLRCRMALNAVKAVVAMSPVTLHRQHQGNIVGIDGQTHVIDRLSTHIRGGNLILRGSCANHANRQRVNHVIFDEQRYKWLHNINELERGMVGLSGQINDIMNAMGNEFRQATSHIKAAPLMKYNTKQYLRWGPIKRLRARMVYGKTNRKFDFDTTATSGSKTVNIKFEKGKFTLSGTFKDKPFEFKGRSLGSLLRKKIDRLRVFDGVELPIFEKINEAMITQLRTNNLISPENFWVSDLNPDKTGRIFFMDSQGDLSYIEIEDQNLNPLWGRTYGRINFNDLPPQRIRCNETERREFMQNPLLSGRLLRGMRNRLRMI